MVAKHERSLNRKRIIAYYVIAVVAFVVVFKTFHERSQRTERVILGRLIVSENNWREAVERRHSYIESKKGVENFKPWGDTGFTVIWNLFPPSFDCPYIRKRIGRIGDGGKWVCGFELLEPLESSNSPCIVYSIGVSFESSFESEMLEKTNCEIFAYDMTVNGMGHEISANNSKVHFKKVGLGADNTDNLRTLSSLMVENGHHWIDIFKIDIEGAEFAVFDSIMDRFDVLPFGQMQIEIHIKDLNISTFYNWFERLESRGLRPFSAEINLDPCVRSIGMPSLMEFSFINVNTSHSLVPSEFLAARQTS